MRLPRFSLFVLTVAMFAAAGSVHPANADGLDLVADARKSPPGGGGGGDGGGGKGGGGKGGGKAPKLYFWMNPEIQGAWDSGFKGQGATITVIDDFSSGSVGFGNLGDGLKLLHHGEWTLKQASMIAPSATMVADDFNIEVPVALSGSGLNVLNLSFGAIGATADYDPNWAAAFPQEDTIISYAHSGAAVVVKSAGNEGIPFGTSFYDFDENLQPVEMQDYLGLDLIGAPSALIVGALDGGYSTPNAAIADYSNSAGLAPDQYLMVRVDSTTGLAGTSFAAPVVSGYAAVLSSKFTNANATQIATQLLDTARTDTITGYDVTIHGQGEASIANALAPASIN